MSEMTNEELSSWLLAVSLMYLPANSEYELDFLQRLQDAASRLQQLERYADALEAIKKHIAVCDSPSIPAILGAIEMAMKK